VTFSEEDLAALAAEDEIRIETRSGNGETHRTTIWVVVESGVVYIRSVNGATARWYREALGDPSVVIHVGGRRRSTAGARAIPARVVPASDPASVEACTAGLRAKYATDPSLRTMLREHTLPTTLRVEAA
jgi:hypothetical protein